RPSTADAPRGPITRPTVARPAAAVAPVRPRAGGPARSILRRARGRSPESVELLDPAAGKVPEPRRHGVVGGPERLERPGALLLGQAAALAPAHHPVPLPGEAVEPEEPLESPRRRVVVGVEELLVEQHEHLL